MLLLAWFACDGDPTTPTTTTTPTGDTGTPACTPAPMDCGTACGTVEAVDSCGDPVTLECGECPGTCTDGALSDDETDVDCGGPTCPACALGESCAGDSDCGNATCQDDRCVDGTWAELPPLPTPRGSLAAVWFQGRLVAIGGYHEDLGARREVEAYDPTVNGWTAMVDLPWTLYGHDAVALTDVIVVAGGSYDGPREDCRTALAYEPTANRWVQLGQLQECRYLGRLFVDGDGVVRMAGGFSPGGGQSDTVERYDRGSDSWTIEPARLATPRSSHAVAVDDAGAPWVFGGRSAAARELDVVERESGGAWFTVTPEMPQGREDLSAAFSSGRFWLIGGLDLPNDGRARRVDVFDGTTWSTGAELPTPRREADAAVSEDGRVWVVGGWREEVGIATASDAAEVLTPTP